MNFVHVLLLVVLLSSCPKVNNQTFSSVPSSSNVSSSFDSSLSSPIECEPLQHSSIKAEKITVLSNKWKEEWTNKMSKALDEPSLSPLTSSKLDIRSGDLSEIGCPNLNKASREEKKRFWIAFMSAIAIPESSHNPKASYTEKSGTVSRGLLQIGRHNADIHCPKASRSRHTIAEIHDPNINLRCGLYIMKHQLNGSKNGSNKNLKGRLFPKPKAYYWSVLTTHKKSKVKNFFNKHKNQLSFCNANTAIPTSTVGENTPLTNNECHNIQNTERVEPVLNNNDAIMNYSIAENTPIEGPACTRALKPWVEKMPSLNKSSDGNTSQFVTRVNNKIRLHIFENNFPFDVKIFEGYGENKKYELNTGNKSFIADFTNSVDGTLRVKNESDTVEKLELKIVTKTEKSPFLTFFKKAEKIHKKRDIQLSSFTKASLESCYGVIMATDKESTESIIDSSKSFNLNLENIDQARVKSENVLKVRREKTDITQ